MLRLLADADQAHRLVVEQERRVDEGVVRRRTADDAALDADLLVQRRHLGRGVQDDRLTRAHGIAADTDLQAVGARFGVEALAVVEQERIGNPLALCVEQGDADDVGPEHVANLLADEVDHRLQVELTRESLLDAVDHRQLGVALLRFLEQPLRLVEQPGVLERDAHTRSHRREKTGIGRVEGVLVLVVLHDDATEQAVAADDRHGHARQARVGSRDDADAQRVRLGPRVDDERLALLESPHHRALGPYRVRFGVDADAVFVFVQVVDPAGLRVAPSDADVSGAKNVAQFVADKIDDRLKVQLRSHPLLDAVDHRQLRVALLGLLEEVLRLLELADIPQSQAHACADGLDHADGGRVEGVFALIVVERDDADESFADREGHGDRTQRRVRAGLRTEAHRFQRRRVGHHERQALDQQPVAPRTVVHGHRLQPVPATVLDLVREMHALRLEVEEADRDVVTQHFAQTIADEVDDRLPVELGRQALLNVVDDRQLRLALR